MNSSQPVYRTSNPPSNNMGLLGAMLNPNTVQPRQQPQKPQNQGNVMLGGPPTQQNWEGPNRSSGQVFHENNLLGQIFNKEQLEEQLQKFRFPDPHIRYKIMPAEEDKLALDVTTIDDGDKLVKGNIIIWEYHGGPNQQFYFKRVGDNKFQIISAATGFGLEVPNESQSDQVQIVSNPRNDNENQVFEVLPCGKGIYKIMTFCGKCLDIQNHFLRNGNPVIQYEWSGRKNQKWKIWPG